MHVHMKPIVVAWAPVSQPAKASKASGAQTHVLDALLDASRDQGSGSGSRSKQQSSRDQSSDDDPVRNPPTSALEVLLTDMLLDRDLSPTEAAK